jgi:uncharacterized protein (TIGR02246 family)
MPSQNLVHTAGITVKYAMIVAVFMQNIQDDRQAIQKLSEDWVAAVRSKDITRLTDMVTDDVIFLPPGFAPIRGKQAVEAMYNQFFPQFSGVEQTASVEEVEVSGDWAFAWGMESCVLVPHGGGSPIHLQGKGLSVLRRQSDGSWKFARGINNSLPRAMSQP